MGKTKNFMLDDINRMVGFGEDNVYSLPVKRKSSSPSLGSNESKVETGESGEPSGGGVLPGFSGWTGGRYGWKRKLEDLAGEIADMDYSKFTEGEDYAALAKRYQTSGKKAMDDTMGMAAARTGGLASSYAVAAGNQAYNDHMSKLEDAARGLYDSQRQEKIDQFGIEQSMYDRNVANNQWQQKFIADQAQRDIDNTYRQTAYDDDMTLKLIEKEETDLSDAIYNNANIYPDYAAYKEAFPNSLLSKSDFERIVSNVSGAQKRALNTVTPADMEKEDIDQWVEDKKYPSAAINARYKEIYGKDIPYYFGEEGEEICKGLNEIFASSTGKDGTVYSLPDDTKVHLLENLLKFNGGGESTYEMIINMAEALGYDLDPLMEILTNKSNKE